MLRETPCAGTSRPARRDHRSLLCAKRTTPGICNAALTTMVRRTWRAMRTTPCASATIDLTVSFLLSCSLLYTTHEAHFTHKASNFFKFSSIADIEGGRAFHDTFDHACERLAGADFDECGDARVRHIFDAAHPLYGRGNLLRQLALDVRRRCERGRGDVADDGNGGIAHACGRDGLRQPLCRRLHDRRVEGGADGERDDSFRATRFCQLHRPCECALLARNDDLARRIIVGNDDAPITRMARASIGLKGRQCLFGGLLA